jgi:dTDP-4-amino-4,6-dideoxygalactose transaminase
MKVPQLDLNLLHEPFQAELQKAMEDVLRSGRFIGGPQVDDLEREVAAIAGVPYAAAVSNGTDALAAALQALGVGPGDEVVTSPFTFFATVSAIIRLGAKPIFCDIDPVTYTLKPERVYDYVDDGVLAGKKVTDSNSEHTKVRAILPVHLYGQVADMKPLLELADQFSLMVVEDACQAIGSRWNDEPAGGIGDAGALSFYPSKNLGALGEGGMVLSEDEGVIAAVKQIRNQGMIEQYHHAFVSGNYRMNALTAATLRVKLRHLLEWNRQRTAAAQLYTQMFQDQGMVDDVILPKIEKNRVSNWHQYTIRVDRRDELQAFLAENEIQTQVYYPRPCHLQPAIKNLGYKVGDFPIAEQAAREVISLPLFPGILPEQQEHVVDSIGQFYSDR